MIWITFALCTAVIVFAGTRLSFYGDVIAEKSGLGRTWIGVVLMATVTSLPELSTGISSVTAYNLPNIAAGDVLGSCMFNLLIIGLLDLTLQGAPILTRVHDGHSLTGAYGVLMLGLILVGIMAGNAIPAAGGAGAYSMVLPALYLMAMRSVYLQEQRRTSQAAEGEFEPEMYIRISHRHAYLGFGICALAIVAAATYLPHLGEEIADITGLGRTFVGSAFIALSTSLPEVVISRAALQLGAADMAVGSLLGSNLFNMAILAIDDWFYKKGPILGQIDGSHAITASAAAMMTAVVMIGLVVKPNGRAWRFTRSSVGLILIYVSTIIVLYLKR